MRKSFTKKGTANFSGGSGNNLSYSIDSADSNLVWQRAIKRSKKPDLFGSKEDFKEMVKDIKDIKAVKIKTAGLKIKKEEDDFGFFCDGDAMAEEPSKKKRKRDTLKKIRPMKFEFYLEGDEINSTLYKRMAKFVKFKIEDLE